MLKLIFFTDLLPKPPLTFRWWLGNFAWRSFSGKCRSGANPYLSCMGKAERREQRGARRTLRIRRGSVTSALGGMLSWGIICQHRTDKTPSRGDESLLRKQVNPHEKPPTQPSQAGCVRNSSWEWWYTYSARVPLPLLPSLRAVVSHEASAVINEIWGTRAETKFKFPISEMKIQPLLQKGMRGGSTLKLLSPTLERNSQCIFRVL